MIFFHPFRFLLSEKSICIKIKIICDAKFAWLLGMSFPEMIKYLKEICQTKNNKESPFIRTHKLTIFNENPSKY